MREFPLQTIPCGFLDSGIPFRFIPTRNGHSLPVAPARKVREMMVRWFPLSCALPQQKWVHSLRLTWKLPEGRSCEWNQVFHFGVLGASMLVCGSVPTSKVEGTNSKQRRYPLNSCGSKGVPGSPWPLKNGVITQHSGVIDPFLFRAMETPGT